MTAFLEARKEFDGAFEVAGDWPPLAVRARLTPEIDIAAVALALQAIEADGMQRCVNLSPDSLVDSAFASRLRTRLATQPSAAKQLWLEVGESAAADRFDQVRELARQVRPLGVRFGLEHAGERLSRIERLFEAGIDYVKLDAAVTREVGAEAGRAAFVTGLATMLHSLQLQVIAEGVVSADDAAALWQCGVDGMTGPWVSEQQAR
jgi:EAL domain-containing protein (putative c-di-GMP-specific phosphodiesterase class I)